MRIVSDFRELAYPQGSRVGFVPTMGAFHEGHLELMRQAKHECDHVVVSLFVNPTQFGKGEDFDRYPRDIERDAALAESAGVDTLFAPSVDAMYPAENPTMVTVPEITTRWEGSVRPGHFDGVATVVLKLFNLVRPTTSYFGLKDLQQCLVIRKMVKDLNIDLALSFQPTVREPDGLAMSSRNAYLSAEERNVAPKLYQSLLNVRNQIEVFGGNSDETERIITQEGDCIRSYGFELNYLEWVDLERMSPNRDPRKASALIVAAKIGKTRLIDNLLFDNSFG